MSHVIYPDSSEYQRIQREQRIHEMPRVPGASAVHVVFAAQAHIVERGKLSDSMTEARRLVHQLMEQYDANNPALTSGHHATLRPITAQQVRTMQSVGAQVLDASQIQAYCDLIVQTCYGTIRDCDESQVSAHAGRPRTSHAWIHTKGNAVRVRVSPTFGKRLAAQEQRQSAKRTIGLWPAILGLDEWEALATAHQDKLCADTRGDAPVVITEPLRDPADVTHRYKPGGNVFATRVR